MAILPKVVIDAHLQCRKVISSVKIQWQKYVSTKRNAEAAGKNISPISHPSAPRFADPHS